jgi:hypothetical protein
MVDDQQCLAHVEAGSRRGRPPLEFAQHAV